ncbi:MAG: PorP/SprF family type IX secretion system membrane protein [Crocinitomicaceae bacterium]|jgi:type IX secretion system PorP/SprF family membrane protein|nr:PorP/SprF family type IX secretion system membrane protein [Crocinitomicaceae bacterium]
MKQFFYLISLSLLSTNGFSQDIHFAQSSQTPLLINPGATGVYDGWERVIINHRNQWLGANTQFMTTAIAADVNFLKTELNDKPHLGLGLFFYNDIGGDSKFGNQTGAVSLSGIIPFDRTGHVLSVGIQGGVGHRKASLESVSFMSQWNGTQFDPQILSGENNTLSSFTYLDASAGVNYVFNGGKSTFKRNNNFKLKIGVAGYHLNNPKMKYVNGSGDRLHRKYVGHLGVETDLGGSKMALEVNAVQFVQGGHYESLLGVLLKYRLEGNTKLTGFRQDAFIGIGCYTRIKDAIIPAVMLDYKGFQFGISYDVTVSKLRQAYKGGSLEFSLAYTNRNTALFTKRRGGGKKF